MEARRRLAVQRVNEGWKRKDVAAFLGVHPETVSEWVRAHEAGGDAALAAKPHLGRKPFLTADQEKRVLRLVGRPADHARVPDRPVDGPAGRPPDRQPARGEVPPPVPAGVAGEAGRHPAEAGPAGEPTGPGSHRPVAQGRLAPDQKNACRQKAHLVPTDESGLLLNPRVRRSWALKGRRR